MANDSYRNEPIEKPTGYISGSTQTSVEFYKLQLKKVANLIEKILNSERNNSENLERYKLDLKARSYVMQGMGVVLNLNQNEGSVPEYSTILANISNYIKNGDSSGLSNTKQMILDSIQPIVKIAKASKDLDTKVSGSAGRMRAIQYAKALISARGEKGFARQYSSRENMHTYGQ